MNEDIWLVYCSPTRQYSVRIPYQPQMNVLQAIAQSGIAQQTDLPQPLQVGIFGLKVNQPEQHIVEKGDRIEIYRPLTMNPKEVRRKRAERHPVGRYRRGNQWRKKYHSEA